MKMDKLSIAETSELKSNILGEFQGEKIKKLLNRKVITLAILKRLTQY